MSGGDIDESVPFLLVSASSSITEGDYSWAPPLNGRFTVLELPSVKETIAWTARMAISFHCDQELGVFHQAVNQRNGM